MRDDGALPTPLEDRITKMERGTCAFSFVREEGYRKQEKPTQGTGPKGTTDKPCDEVQVNPLLSMKHFDSLPNF